MRNRVPQSDLDRGKKETVGQKTYDGNQCCDGNQCGKL